MAYRRRLGCCGASALGQLEPGASAAVVAPELPYPASEVDSDGLPRRTLGQLFFLSVGAGLTVWAVTKLLDKKG
jgi:hypothetical protein